MNKQYVVEQAKAKLDVISAKVNNILPILEMCRYNLNGDAAVQLLQLLDSASCNLKLAYSECQSLISVPAAQSQPCQNRPQISWLPQVTRRVPVVLMKGDDPWDFFLTYPDRTQQLGDLQKLLESTAHVVCSVLPLEFSPVVIFEKGQYYRATTTGPVWRQSGRVGILKIDYNETSLVNVSELYVMPEDVAKFPCQVISCCLKNDSSLKKVWSRELKAHFSQLCQDFPLKIDVVKEVVQSSQPKFLVKLWIFHEHLKEEASVNRWLNGKLFPAIKEVHNAGEDTSDEFMRLYDVLSPFSLQIDELCEEHRSGDRFTTESDTTVCQVADTELNGTQGVGAVSEDEYETDQPLPEQIEMSVRKVSEWMEYKSKQKPVEQVIEPSFDHYRTKRANSKQISGGTSFSPENDAPVVSFSSSTDHVDRSGISSSSLHSGFQEERSSSIIAEACERNTNRPYLPLEGRRVKIHVHHVVSGTSFYASINEFSIDMGAPGSTGNTMSALYEDINEVRSHPPLDSPPRVGDTLLAQGLQRYLSYLGKGKKWLRAVVKEVAGTFVEVFFVDFGNTDTVPVKDLCKLRPEFASLPFQALLVKLAFLEQAKREAQAKLTALIKGKLLLAEIVRRDATSTGLEVILFDGSISINNLLTAEELCKPL